MGFRKRSPQIRNHLSSLQQPFSCCFGFTVSDVIENPNQGMWYTFQLMDPEGMSEQECTSSTVKGWKSAAFFDLIIGCTSCRKQVLLK